MRESSSLKIRFVFFLFIVVAVETPPQSKNEAHIFFLQKTACIKGCALEDRDSGFFLNLVMWVCLYATTGPIVS